MRAGVRGGLPGQVLSVLALVLLVPAVARGQTTEGEAVESPQRFAFEARFGPYYPDVDESVGTVCGQGPYATIFGDKQDLYAEFEFDWQALDIFVGSLAVGGAVGVMHASATALEEGSCTTRASDETGLWLLPLSLLAVVRFDIFADRWAVPLVPYVKVGLTYALWFATGENGISQVDEESGVGGTFGLRLGGGIMLRLDWLDTRAARTFDNEFGVNHSYLFFEYYWAWLDGFGQDGRMNVGDATWTVGLAIEF